MLNIGCWDVGMLGLGLLLSLLLFLVVRDGIIRILNDMVIYGIIW